VQISKILKFRPLRSNADPDQCDPVNRSTGRSNSVDAGRQAVDSSTSKVLGFRV